MTLASVHSSPLTVDLGWLGPDMSQSPQTAETHQKLISRGHVPRSLSPLTLGEGKVLPSPMPRVFTTPHHDYSWAIAPECRVVERILAAISDNETSVSTTYAYDVSDALRLHSESALAWGDLLVRVFEARYRLVEDLPDYRTWIRVMRAIDPHVNLVSVPDRFVLTTTSDTPPVGIDEEVAADIETMFEND